MDLEALKADAARQAAAHVKSGMVVGLGTGSTAKHLVAELGRRLKEEGLKIVGVPTSERTAEQARSLGIKLATLEEEPKLDLAIDGADEIELGTLDLIKGAGGALLRERLVESAAKTFIVIADETKKVEKLGTRFKVPVEVVRFGWKSTFARLEALGVKPRRRETDGKPFVTDEQHYTFDCATGQIPDARKLAAELKAVTGVVDHGLFIGMASECLVATSTGVEVLKKK
ncbi:MAG: ribose-5-phosphate isomerase RpiA [Planctomycetota bacterium]|nr:ribose-5-phosphate isomerase RpiA [Planctomycetota bacterium]